MFEELYAPPLLLLVLLSVCSLGAQNLAESNQLALDHARAQKVLAEADLVDLAVDHSYTDAKLGVTYVYLQQRIGEIPVEGAGASLAIKDGEVFSFRQNFVSGLAARTTNVVARIDDQRAVQAAATSLGYTGTLKLRASNVGVLAKGQRRFEAATTFVSSEIVVKDIYALNAGTGKLRRAITVDLDQRRGDYMHVTVDAATGEVLASESYTHHCKFEAGFGGHATHDALCTDADEQHSDSPIALGAKTFTTAAVADGSSYRVFAWPAESPTHGPQLLVKNPADSIASPFGWHDTNGQAGAEFTITRGNNTHAYVDALDSNRVEPGYPEPNGGPTLTFDIPYDLAKEPIPQSDATTINLFYAVNRMHDFAFHNGFDEAAGNFQVRNYSGQGRGSDPVFSESQDGSLTGGGRTMPLVDYTNNANFSTPPDGSSGRMQMYLWDANNIGSPITVSSPGTLAGRSYGEIGVAATGWGDNAVVGPNTNVTAGIAVARDNTANTSFTDACEPITNGTEVAGRIAIIDRGGCEFGLKALNAQNAGAVAVIICTFDDVVGNLGGGVSGPSVNVPTFMLSRTGCTTLLADAAANPDLRLTIRQAPSATTTYVSGSLDNGIVAHEFGHGISTRLTGGPNVSCLRNAEQMGEGWSDFFSLVTSVRPGDGPDQPRGIGTYAQRQPTNGSGIRPFPYTRDMKVNPVTYADVADGDRFSQPHGIGSIWASMLWDLHWNLVDVYGFGADLNYDTLGNNKAIQLVMTGMKLQGCNPGFVDGREGILAADRLLFGGRHRQLIWRTFARRGLGFFADQGSSDNRSDGAEDFNLPLDFVNRTFFTKSVTETIDAGGEVTVSLQLANYIDSVKVLPTVSITDVLPQGATLVGGSVNREFRQNGSVLSFDLANVAKGDSISISYKYTAADEASKLYWYQPALDEFADEFLAPYNLTLNALTNFELVGDDGYKDEFSWRFDGVAVEIQPVIEIFDDYPVLVRGDRPMFSFFHKLDIVGAHEGAVVEIITEDVNRWVVLPNSAFVRNGYTSRVPYQAFIIPLLEGFGSTTEADWEQVLVDLSPYSGQKIRLRWRYGREDEVAEEPVGGGWSLDEFAQVDAITYNTPARMTIGSVSEEIRAEGVGTYVNHDNMLVSSREVAPEVRFVAYPNPVSQDLQLVFDLAGAAGRVDIVSVTGQRMMSQPIGAGERQGRVAMGQLAAGVYVVRVERGGDVSVVRVVKR